MTRASARPVASNGVAWRRWLRREFCPSPSSSAGAASRDNPRGAHCFCDLLRRLQDRSPSAFSRAAARACGLWDARSLAVTTALVIDLRTAKTFEQRSEEHTSELQSLR